MKYQNKQNKIILVGLILIICVVIWAAIRPLIISIRTKNSDPETKINEEILKAPLITPSELSNKLSSNDKIVVIDTRSSNEFSTGHIMRAYNEDIGTLDVSRLETLGLQKNMEIVLANAGDDIYTVAKKTNDLIASGYTSVKYLQGGIKDWKNQGYALISSGGSPFDQSKVKKITINDLAQDSATGLSDVQFLDVRSAADFKSGHIAGALNIPLENVENDKDQISSLKKVVVYADTPDHASQAAVTLFDLNFLNVFVLDGGLDAWENAGGNLEKSN